jgi:hypothetical protein
MNPQRCDIAMADWNPGGVSNVIGTRRRRGLAS